MRSRLSKALNEQLKCSTIPIDLQANAPAYRAQDGIAWDTYTHVAREGKLVKVHIFSFDTMGDCVRYGFDVSHLGTGSIEIVAKDTSK